MSQLIGTVLALSRRIEAEIKKIHTQWMAIVETFRNEVPRRMRCVIVAAAGSYGAVLTISVASTDRWTQH